MRNIETVSLTFQKSWLWGRNALCFVHEKKKEIVVSVEEIVEEYEVSVEALGEAQRIVSSVQRGEDGCWLISWGSSDIEAAVRVLDVNSLIEVDREVFETLRALLVESSVEDCRFSLEVAFCVLSSVRYMNGEEAEEF